MQEAVLNGMWHASASLLRSRAEGCANASLYAFRQNTKHGDTFRVLGSVGRVASTT